MGVLTTGFLVFLVKKIPELLVGAFLGQLLFGSIIQKPQPKVIEAPQRLVLGDCGGILRSRSGNITTPDFPDFYPANKRCVWTIVAPENSHVTLSFTYFDLEGEDICKHDSVHITSVADSKRTKDHGLFCGNGLPLPVTSDGNMLRIEFTSDNSVQKRGFSSFFTTGPKLECSDSNGRHLHPYDCTKYIECIDHVAHERSCPSGLQFSDSMGCTLPMYARCGTSGSP